MISTFSNNYRYIKKHYPTDVKAYYKYVSADKSPRSKESASLWQAFDNADKGRDFPFNSARIKRLNIPAPELGDSEREILVWLPSSYFSGHKRFGVLYMQDGDNIFKDNPKAPYGTWDIDVTLDSLINSGEIEPLIVVGISTKNRFPEYLNCPIDNLGFRPRLADYTRYVINTLKPAIDHLFRTKSAPAYTAIGGSSLGALSALRIAWKNSNVFSKVAAFSPSSWVGSVNNERTSKSAESLEKMIKYSPLKPNLKIYLDNGTIYNEDDQEENYTSDAWVYTDHLRNALVEKGFDLRQEWLAEGAEALENLPENSDPAQVSELFWSMDLPKAYATYYDYLRPDLNLCHLVARWHGHNEASWKARFAMAMRYLYGAN